MAWILTIPNYNPYSNVQITPIIQMALGDCQWYCQMGSLPFSALNIYMGHDALMSGAFERLPADVQQTMKMWRWCCLKLVKPDND